MTLIKTSLLNAIAVVVKMLTFLGINKLLALYVGPAGYAALGQFQNSVQMITAFASGAINTGVVKYTAEFHDDEAKQRTVWRTAGTIAILGSLLTGLLVVIYSESLAAWFLKDERLSGVFVWFAATLVFFVLNTLLLAILNGKKDIQRYVISNIAGSLFALIITGAMVIKLGLYGALVALAVYQSLAFIVTILLCYKASWFRFKYLFGRIDFQTAKNLAKYAAMALVSVVCVPISHIFVRNHLGETISWEAAGYWEAMWRLSTAYLMLVTSTLSVYYLPRLSELKTVKELKNEVTQGYKIILPIMFIFGFLLFLLKDIVIKTLFSADFADMEILFKWQIIGDFFKVASWVLAFLMLSKAMVGLFIFSEITFSVSFYILTLYFTSIGGIIGVSEAYAFNYFIYFLFMYYTIFRKLSI